MSADKRRSPAHQQQDSAQSMEQGETKPHDKPRPESADSRPIGASQKQDEAAAPERRSAGTPDIERGSEHDVGDSGNSRDSLVNDPTGAFKERP